MDRIDLKPVSQETIDSMGITDHDLWLVKFDVEVFGPFEQESLRHYASENEILFGKAFTTRRDQEDWQPFYSHTFFQRRVSGVAPRNAQGPFWIMENGLKSHPLSLSDLEKKIKDGKLVVTELISSDDGHSWHKIYEIPQFDRRANAQDLPQIPLESNFKAAASDLEERRERRANTSIEKEDLAETAHQALQTEKTLSFNINEVQELPRVGQAPSHKGFKWAISAGVSLVMSVVGIGSFLFTDHEDVPVAEVTGQAISGKPEASNSVNPSAHLDMPKRLPANYGPSNPAPPPSLPMPQQFPSYTETHQSPPDHIDRHDPMLDSPPEENLGGNGQPTEHSLVQSGLPPEEGEPRQDAAMGPEIAQPVVEESSDF